MVAGVAGLADGSFDGKADESDVGFSVIGFAEMALVGLRVVGLNVGLFVTHWVDGFVVSVSDDVGRDDGMELGFVDVG